MHITKETTYEAFYKIVTLLTNAYPLAVPTEEEAIHKLATNLEDALTLRPDQHVFSVRAKDEIVGCMRYFDFNMQLFGEKLKVGGIGMVAVDILHKKKGIAKLIVSDFLDYYKKQGYTMATLFPFRPDFYKNMGFGFGRSMNQFRIPPKAFPKGVGKEHVIYLGKKDIGDMLDCYHRYQQQTNGLFDKYADEYEKEMDQGRRFIGYKKNGALEGMFAYTIEKTSDVNTMTQNMRVFNIIAENAEALMAFSAFFNSQIDQIERVIVNVQDEAFQYLFGDPRNHTDHNMSPHFQECSVQGTGVMYRLIDNVEFFKGLKSHSFGGQTVTVSFDIEDDFLLENNGTFTVSFEEGYPVSVLPGRSGHVTVSMNVANFTSLVTGCVDFRSLLRYNQATISDKGYMVRVNRLFDGEDAPICMTRF